MELTATRHDRTGRTSCFQAGTTARCGLSGCENATRTLTAGQTSVRWGVRHALQSAARWPSLRLLHVLNSAFWSMHQGIASQHCELAFACLERGLRGRPRPWKVNVCILQLEKSMYAFCRRIDFNMAKNACISCLRDRASSIEHAGGELSLELSLAWQLQLPLGGGWFVPFECLPKSDGEQTPTLTPQFVR